MVLLLRRVRYNTFLSYLLDYIFHKATNELDTNCSVMKKKKSSEIMTSTVDVNDESRGRPLQKAKV